MSIVNQIDIKNVPEHVAIIMDGNGRWAKMQGEMRLFGHTSGVESVREAISACLDLGVKYLTLYTFSTENWNRPKEEVDGRMNLMVQTISGEVDTLQENEVMLHSIGDEEQLPSDCLNELNEAKDKLKANTKLNLILALNYSARTELIKATKAIAQKVEQKLIKAEDVSESMIQNELYTANFPDPELLIRTSGEYRISNFLLWQIAYSELYFTDKLWPDFKKEDLFKAILNYQSRERRFGKVSEQLIS